MKVSVTRGFIADQRGSGRDAKHWLKLLRETTAKAEFLSTSGASPEQIAELTMPVLLMYGEYSRVRKSGDRLRELLRGDDHLRQHIRNVGAVQGQRGAGQRAGCQHQSLAHA